MKSMQEENKIMKRVKWALASVVVSTGLAACTPEPAAPAVEVPAPAAEPAVVAPATEPMAADPMTTTEPAMDGSATDAAEATEEEEDTPHSGGDKVAPNN